MIMTKEQFIHDKRFYVTREDVDRIFENKIYKYKICKVKLSFIKKSINRKIISLSQTTSYKFLNAEIDDTQYQSYCENETFSYEKHSLNSFKKLINDFKGYDIKSGAIVVDQFGLIRDGQHRASILLKRYGPNYEIEIVKVYYNGLHLKKRIKLFLKMVNDICKKF